MFRIFALALWGAFLSLAAIGEVAAHPLGNFTINHLARIEARADRLRVHYVLDIAEIPAFQIMHAAPWNPGRQLEWQDAEAALVAQGFVAQADGNRLALHFESASSRTRPGAGGLPILYWTGDFTATIPARTKITIRDNVYSERRIGWKDIILPGLADPTDELRAYPSALIGSPRQNDAATFDVLDGHISNARVSGGSSFGWGAGSVVRTSLLADLFSRDGQTPALILLTILAAFGLGALHGLEPGHGKALLAFTLVGARATFKQAAILAAALTFAHTIAVLLLGIVLFAAAGLATEGLFTWITLISGLVVAAIGARGISNALVHRYAHAHDHHHAHDRNHEHAHAVPGTAPLHFPSAVAAAMSGGIAPCPAAIVVLLTALHLHRVGYGLLLIVVFSLGLASILTALGFGVVHGAGWLSRRTGFTRLAPITPFVTATVISLIGAGMLAQGLTEQGAALSTPAIFALALIAIAGLSLLPFVLSIRSSHRTLAIKETS